MVQKVPLNEIRQRNLQRLVDQHDGKQAQLGKRVGKAAGQISGWISGRRSITEDSAREIEAALRLPRGWMDEPQDGEAVAEPLPAYAPDEWPLRGISRQQLRALDPEWLRLAEDQLKAVLRAATRAEVPTAPSWRKVALGVAAAADIKQGSDAFSQFCLRVDEQYERELAAAKKHGPADVH